VDPAELRVHRAVPRARQLAEQAQVRAHRAGLAQELEGKPEPPERDALELDLELAPQPHVRLARL
jgi:hypothetical protein